MVDFINAPGSLAWISCKKEYSGEFMSYPRSNRRIAQWQNDNIGR